MAEKEATVFVLDLSSSMGSINNGRSESDLDWSMRFVWDKLGDIVAASRKTLCVGIVGVNTDGTDNSLTDEPGYDHISILRPIGPMSLSELQSLSPLIRPHSVYANGDVVSATIVAEYLITEFTKQQTWTRKVYLITDGKTPLDPDGLDEIGEKLNNSKIELTILGVDFDSPEYGFKEEDKPQDKRQNEESLKELAKHCKNGVFATMAEALEDIQTPRVRTIRPYKTYDGWLTLGDPKKSPAAANILVERYSKTKLARPAAATTVVVKAEGEPTQIGGGEGAGGMDFAAVRQARTYKVNDPAAPGGKRDVEFERLAKGYEYGRTVVPISESEHNITKLRGQEKSFKIFEPFLNMGEVCATIASRVDADSELAFASIVWALLENDSYAVARLVAKDEKDPQLLVLVPDLDPEPTLYDMPLPFAEDVRSYQFPPLDRVVTVGGQTLTTHRLLPSDELNQAMSDYVDAMDLSTYELDEEGKPVEYAQTDDVYNPAIHRINHAVKHRAMHPDAPLPDTPPVLLKFASPPEGLVARGQSKIDSLIKAAGVKKVQPLSGLDVDALLGEEPRDRISPENAIPDFKHALAAAKEISEIQDISKQMDAIVRSLITDSFGDMKYNQAFECIGVMRDELSNLEEPGLYNEFARSLKSSILAGDLGGDRRDFWFQLRRANLGLIDKGQSEVSAVTSEEAREFFKSR
ncbi:ATP-dependent DNA helicase II subunit 2 [Escovopsis weberi]|uniref:ATP-dependent DNA helicase II subunit 2 n=1 Tax=Escovopsis weberi TaxID=150374 RepID=A0A0M8MYI1_ESCWE|nr:ATP-dependent DNA helicase II subunit 2 [Escovopsis weberi]